MPSVYVKFQEAQGRLESGLWYAVSAVVQNLFILCIYFGMHVQFYDLGPPRLI